MSRDKGHEIHDLAQFFGVRGNFSGIVILSDNYRDLASYYPVSTLLHYLHDPSPKDRAQFENLPPNIITLDMEAVNADFLHDKLFICLDYLENRRYHYKSFGLRRLKFFMKNSALSICVVVPEHGWDDTRLARLNHSNKTAQIGRTPAGQYIVIAGRQTDVCRFNCPLLPVLAIISQYNEADIIEPVVNHLLGQGVDVHVIDNWSDDGSYEIVRQLAASHVGKVSIERFPVKNTGKYEWEQILSRVTEIGKQSPKYRWIISNDADEIRWSPWKGISLQRAISFVDYLGYNTIDYTVFNFEPTRDGYVRGMDPATFFKYGDYGHEGWHFMQLKTWKNSPKADLTSSGGHLIKLPDKNKIFPLKFLLGHYSIRSNAQAARKIFKERKPRFKKAETKKGWHSHYDKIKLKHSFVKDSSKLIRLAEESDFEKNLLQRLSGIGIRIVK